MFVRSQKCHKPRIILTYSTFLYPISVGRGGEILLSTEKFCFPRRPKIFLLYFLKNLFNVLF